MSRRTTEVLSQFSDGGFYLQFSGTATSDSRWGDYSAASWSGFTADSVWIASQYSNGDWATRIGRIKYLLGDTS